MAGRPPGWTWCWTNWTLGVWWSTKLRRFGIDLGPLEYVSKRRHRKRKPGPNVRYSYPPVKISGPTSSQEPLDTV